MLKLLPPEIILFFGSMLPVIELRGTIPYAMASSNMPAWQVLLWALAGNYAVALILIEMLPPVVNFMRKHLPFFNKLLDWLFHKTRSKHSKRMSELGHIALLTFVAVPLPGSGAWSGVLAAYVFGVDKKITRRMVFIGLVIAGLLMTFGTEGIMRLLQ